MISHYTLTLTAEQLQVVAAGLMELPGKVAYATVGEVQKQVTEQEQALAKAQTEHQFPAVQEPPAHQPV